MMNETIQYHICKFNFLHFYYTPRTHNMNKLKKWLDRTNFNRIHGHFATITLVKLSLTLIDVYA